LRPALCALLLGAGCSTLHDGGGCPPPCPPSCAASCLPSGFCLEASSVVEGAPLLRDVGTVWVAGVAGLPPGAPVVMTFHGRLDVADRDGQLPWDYSIRVSDADRSGTLAFASAGFNTNSLPVEVDWSRSGSADGTGAFIERLAFIECHGRTRQQACLLLPGTRVTVRLAAPEEWTAAPACAN
jgi:hypothetical protein